MFSELIKSTSFWIIISVIVGFFLGEGTRWLRVRQRIKKLKRMIKEELKSIEYQIPQKKDIVDQILANLEKGKLLSGESVNIINTGYKNHISEIYECLSFKQRNCLHVIYERLEIGDKWLSSFVKDYLSAQPGNIEVAMVSQLYKIYFNNLLKSYDVVLDCINKYLDGNPPDVFYVESSKQ